MTAILAIDDAIVLRTLYKGTLGKDYDLHLADDGEAGLAMAKQNLFDLVITDIQLPGIGGIEVIQQLRALPNYKDVPIVVASGDSSEIKEAIAQGANVWLLKPINPKSLQMAVKKRLARYHKIPS